MTTGLVHLKIPPFPAQSGGKLPARKISVVSRDRNKFVANQSKAHDRRSDPVEVVCRHCIADILAKLVPRVSLREYIFALAFGAETAVRLLRDIKN